MTNWEKYFGTPEKAAETVVHLNDNAWMTHCPRKLYGGHSCGRCNVSGAGGECDFGALHEPIVRCRDCKHYDDVVVGCEHFSHSEYDKTFGYYVDVLEPVEPDGFCKWGERKESE